MPSPLPNPTPGPVSIQNLEFWLLWLSAWLRLALVGAGCGWCWLCGGAGLAAAGPSWLVFGVAWRFLLCCSRVWVFGAGLLFAVVVLPVVALGSSWPGGRVAGRAIRQAHLPLWIGKAAGPRRCPPPREAHVLQEHTYPPRCQRGYNNTMAVCELLTMQPTHTFLLPARPTRCFRGSALLVAQFGSQEIT